MVSKKNNNIYIVCVYITPAETMVNLGSFSILLGWYPFFKSSESFFSIDLRLSTRRFTFFFLGGAGDFLVEFRGRFFGLEPKQRLVTRCSWHHFFLKFGIFPKKNMNISTFQCFFFFRKGINRNPKQTNKNTQLPQERDDVSEIL